MGNFDLKKYLAEGRLFEETQKIELNTSFLENTTRLKLSKYNLATQSSFRILRLH